MAADRLISSGGPWEAKIGYSRAVVAGEYVHVSGSTATVNGEVQHKGDAYGQTLVALETVIAAALAQVGYNLEDVVRTRVYLANAEDMDKVYAYFPRLRERASQQAGTLSGGEQQMLAIGRALMGRPRLLLLDEPSFGLAPLVVKDIFAIMRRINQEEKVSILLVEQNAKLALDIADTAYLLETGRVVLQGSSADMRSNDAVRRAYLGE